MGHTAREPDRGHPNVCLFKVNTQSAGDCMGPTAWAGRGLGSIQSGHPARAKAPRRPRFWYCSSCGLKALHQFPPAQGCQVGIGTRQVSMRCVCPLGPGKAMGIRVQADRSGWRPALVSYPVGPLSAPPPPEFLPGLAHKTWTYTGSLVTEGDRAPRAPTRLSPACHLHSCRGQEPPGRPGTR